MFEAWFSTGSRTSGRQIKQGNSTKIRTIVPAKIYRRLTKSLSGTVTVVVTVKSTNGTLVTDSVRTGLKR